MSQVHKLRESMERKLDQWETRADTFEDALAKSRAEVSAQVEHAKTALGHAADALAERVEASKGLTGDARAELGRAFEHLHVQLALGKAETRDVVSEQREHLAHAVARAEDALERNLHRLDERTLEARLRLLEAADRAEAHLEVAELYMAEEVESAKLGLKKEARDLRALLARLKVDLAEQRRGAAEKASRFEHEMSDAFSHIRKAFRELVS